MPHRKAPRTLVALTFVGALALTGCSANTSTGADAAEAANGGTLTIGLDREIPTLDVSDGLLAQQPVLILTNALYPALMLPDAGGTFAPGMAESMTPNDDASTWTLVLRDGLEFSDGTPLTTESVQAHIDRLADPATGSSSAAQAAQIASMSIVSDTEMTFALAAPNADFVSQFARGLGMVTSTTSTDEFGFPIGAGPFVVDEFTPGDSVTVVRNDDYWGDPAELERITYDMMPDADSRFQSMRAGDIDLMWTEVTSQFQEARDDDSLAVHAAPAAVSSIMLNLENEKFADPEVRLALAQAIDRDAINSVVNLGEGTTVDSAYSLLGDLAPDIDYPEYKPDAARAVLEGENLSFTLTVENRSDTIQRATALKDMLAQVGVEVAIEPIESASFGSALGAKDFEAADFITSVFSDPSGGTLVATSEGAYNFTGYANDDVDAALADASSTVDTDARAESLEIAATEMATDLPLLWLTASHAGLIGSAELTGIPDLTGNTLISVQPELIGRAG
ncbi:MAG: ABC transporter substrate-binding protein [Pseudoclavibacter sp.]